MDLVQITRSITVAIVTFIAAGCGNGMARVEGTVTLDGQPIERGSITLEPSDGQGAPSGGNIESGKFVINDVSPGTKKVQFYAVKLIGRVKLDADDPNSPLVDSHEEILGPQFNAHSSFTLDVKAPLTSHEFKLDSKTK